KKSLYLPPGDWYELLNGKKYTGKKDIEVPADFTEIPVFARAGAVIPLLNDAPDTFAGGDSGVIVTLDQVLEKGLTILVFRGGGGSFTLEDGVEISQKFTALCEPVLFELTETYDKDQQGSGGAKMIHEEIKEFKVEDDFYGGFDYELKVTGGGDFSIAGYNGEGAECVNIRVKGSVKKRDFRFLVWNP
ncbi:MAG: hypothetical protein FJ088_08670, partial [Deltaproteobacteria bacterium]|nr:hypothetical protein [Deltaproteobacteria bacterium]